MSKKMRMTAVYVNELTEITQQYANKQQINSCETNNAIVTAIEKIKMV